MRRCKLGIVDTSQPTTIYIDEDGKYIDAILAQGSLEDLQICDFAHREWTITEKKAPRIERLCLGALWVIKRLSRYTYHVPKLYISLPHEAEMHVATCGTTLPPKLQAKLIELSSFKC